MKDAPIHFFSAKLNEFFYFDEYNDCISSGRKYDGSVRRVYLTDIRKEFLTLAPTACSVIIKELSHEQAAVYRRLSMTFHPSLEKIYGVLEKDGHFISINEFIEAPVCLDYERRSICLEEAVLHFGCFSERDALIYLCQLCEGLEALRKYMLIHSDISPKNILLTDAPAWSGESSPIPPSSQNIWMKLIDFDISRQQKGWNHAVTTVAGTKPFAAPEILDFRYPTDRVDIYSMGCILHYMLTGKSPKDAAFGAAEKRFGRNTMQIIEKCTTGYEWRYKNVSELKKAAMRGVRMTSGGRFNKLLCHIPGFRSGTHWKMAAASLYYFWVLLECQPCYKLPGFLFLTGQFLTLQIIFDVFHLGHKFPGYVRVKNKYPFLIFQIKIFVVLLILYVSVTIV